MIGKLLTFFVVGLVALVGISIVLAVAGVVFSVAWVVAGFVLFKVVPILVVGYLIVRFLAPKRRRLEEADHA